MSGLDNRSDIIGKHDSELPWHAIAEEICMTDNKVIQKEQPIELEETPTIASGDAIVFLTMKTPLYREEKLIGLIGISQDITKRKKTEHELKLALELAKRSEEKRKEFLKNQEHDILTAISGIQYAALALEYSEDLESAKNAAFTESLMIITKFCPVTRWIP